jgi:DNA polymerase III alpha subunit
VLADYRATGLSLTQHPLALLREQLAAYKVQPAAVLRTTRNGRLARASGLVTHRQRPETAKGVVFVTLEDETGASTSSSGRRWPRRSAGRCWPARCSRSTASGSAKAR